MRIKDLESGYELNVYGLYWSGNQTYFYGFAKNSFGLTSYVAEHSQVVDPEIGIDFVFLKTTAGGGVYHKHLAKDSLLDRLVDHDPEAYQSFLSLLGREP
jgi:hypothetical protein